MSLSGSFSNYPCDGFGLYCSWSGKQDISKNQTRITLRVYLRYYLIDVGERYDSTVSINNKKVTYTSDAIDNTEEEGKDNYTLIKEYVLDVPHNDNGTKSCELSASWRFDGYYDEDYIGTITTSTIITLDTIPRSSKILDNSSVTIDNYCNIQWKPASTSYRYRIKFSLGNWNYTTGVINPKTTNTYAYKDYYIPIEVIRQMINTESSNMNVYLGTYSDSAGTKLVGTIDKKVFNVTVPANVCPTLDASSVTLALINNNPIIENWGIGISGYTKVKITAEANGIYDSTIKEYLIKGTYDDIFIGSSLSYDGDIIYSSGDKNFTISAKDSRGRSSNLISKTIYIYPYSNPKINSFAVVRDATDSSKVKIKANWSYSDIENRNLLVAKLFYKKSSDLDWIESENDNILNNEIISLSDDYDESSSYHFKLVITDSLSSSNSKEIFLSTKSVSLNLKAGGKGLGIGKIAETDNLEIGFDTHIMNGKALYGRDASNNPINVMQPCNSYGNLTIGFGNYEKESGNTNIYGDKIILSTRKGLHFDGVLFSDLYYKPGDRIVYKNNTPLAALITGDKKLIYLSIPISKPTIGVDFANTTFTGKLQGRSIDGYLLNPTDGNSIYDLDSQNGFSYQFVNFSGGIITLALIFESELNIKNNTPISIVPDGDFVVTLS